MFRVLKGQRFGSWAAWHACRERYVVVGGVLRRKLVVCVGSGRGDRGGVSGLSSCAGEWILSNV